jgi:hypothetical protein
VGGLFLTGSFGGFMIKYVRICKGVTDKGQLVPVDDDIMRHVNDDKHDWYRSLYHYNGEHFKTFKETGTIKGITDVETNRLVWDFDSKDNLEVARHDSIELCSRLISDGIAANDLRICFSGRKGFAVEVVTQQTFNVKEFRNITSTLAEGLTTYDPVVSNASRIVRIEGTKHQQSGLYKRPLSLDQLSDTPINMIKEWASNLKDIPVGEGDWGEVNLPDAVIKLKVDKKVEQKVQYQQTDLDFKSKPKGFPNCKFAIMNGFFEEGSRSTCLTALAATCRASHYPKEIAYSICKGAARLQSTRTGSEAFPKEEIWNNIISQVYNPTWKGGQYSCKSDPVLKKVCDSLGEHRCKEDEDKIFVSLSDVSTKFEDFAVNIEKNTIKLGIPEIDDQVQLMTGSTAGLLGAPSSGKTSALLTFLNNASKNEIDSVLFSMDMAPNIVFLKLVQKHTGKQRHEVFEAYKHDKRQVNEWVELLKQEYKNVCFSFRTGNTTLEMKEAIMRHQDTTGRKVKLVGYDYLECIQGPYSDATANTAVIANQIKDIGNELDVLNMLLLQPQKHAGDPSEPLLSMRNVKGSSVIEQACATIITIYREGFGPKSPEKDKFITISTVKDRMGSLASIDLGWTGLTGNIYTLTDEERDELHDVRSNKKAQKAAESSRDPWG